MKRQRAFLLLGDNHPEILAIANQLAYKGVEFNLVLPVFFHSKELIWLNNFPKIYSFAKKRQIPVVIPTSQVKRPLILIEILIWLLGQIGLIRSQQHLANVNRKFYSIYLNYLIFISSPKTIITYDTFKIKKKDFKLIVICPTIHPFSHELLTKEARLRCVDWPEPNNSLRSLVQRVTIENADVIVVLSEFAAQSFVKNLDGKPEIKRINIGPKRIFNQSNQLPKKEEKLEIVFLGRLTLVKGISEILDISWILPKNFSISLVGNCSDEIYQYLQKKSNSEILKIYRHQSYEEIGTIISRAHIMLHPSYIDGFSISCMEGLRSGLIPIFSTNSGVSEVLRGTPLENLVVTPGASQKIVEKIQYLDTLSWHQLNQLSNKAREISINFSFEKFAKDFLLQILNIE